MSTPASKWHIRPRYGFGEDAMCGKPSDIRWTGAYDLTGGRIPDNDQHFCRNCAKAYNRKLKREAAHG